MLKLPELQPHPAPAPLQLRSLCVTEALLCQTVIFGRLLAPCPSAPRAESTHSAARWFRARTRDVSAAELSGCCLATGRREIMEEKEKKSAEKNKEERLSATGWGGGGGYQQRVETALLTSSDLHATNM